MAFSPIRIKLFTETYLNQLPNLKNFVHPDELARCNRLGITYENVDLKCFISYFIPIDLKDSEYSMKIENFDEEYTAVELDFPNENYRKTLYFKDGYYISPVSFHTRNWPVFESEHFRFIVSNDSLFNDYSIQNLENFLQQTMYLLEFNEADRNLLKQEKIDYVLCKDADEIEKITGFNTRGIYLLAQDCVVSIFNSHYHELAHLLINFKLKSLPLYTHPFLQEGFAVAVGGRGGKEPNVILDMGKFLLDSSLLDYTDLLTENDFYNVDASLSYPVCGLYNKFLMQNIGIEKYLQLYRKFSSNNGEFFTININDLPDEKIWNSYFKKMKYSSVRLKDKSNFNILSESANFIILQNADSYCFKTKGSLLLKSNENFSSYKSNLFQQKFLDLDYSGEKYLILVSEEEVLITIVDGVLFEQKEYLEILLRLN